MSRIVGIKLTHDGAVACIEDGKLLFSVEIEKLRNNPRYSAISDVAQIEQILADEEIDIDSVDTFVIDGWRGGHVGAPHDVCVAPYHEHDGEWRDMLDPIPTSIVIGGKRRKCVSYTHVTGHIMGAYMTASFCGEPTACIVMDGGIVPRLYEVTMFGIEFVKQLSKLNGLLYGIMGYYAGPYKRDDIISGTLIPTPEMKLFGGRDVPGKLMSWIAKGKPTVECYGACQWAYDELPDAPLHYSQTGNPEHMFMRRVKAECPTATDEDLLATVHHFIEMLLVKEATSNIVAGSNLIFVGGSALNIKWNSALRDTRHFKDVWVPPFTNDSGSAIGQAAADAFTCDGQIGLDWSVYSGPKLAPRPAIWLATGDWLRAGCSIQQLARTLATYPYHPVAFLHGRAEIGPRALGHRSIFMSAASPYGMEVINKIKNREAWRPVAPICLEEDAQLIFDPGTEDPYMLFDHSVREEWKNKIPTVVHLDGTARLQTVGKDGCPVVRELLLEFKKITGVGLLCNTSANLNGSGFFPDIYSAMDWDGCAMVWAEDELYCKYR